MIRNSLFAAVLLLAGCQTCQEPSFDRRPDTADPWNTNYLIDADPSTVTDADLHARAASLTVHYWDYCQVNGMLSPPWRTDPSLALPDCWQRGGDNCLFTGQALAAWSLRYKVSHSDEALETVQNALRGLYLLSHVTGTPGVIVRTIIPESKADKFGWPGDFSSRDPRFLGTGPALTDPFTGAPVEPHHYYSRSTKDQMTGVVIGLAAVWALTDGYETDPAVPASHHAGIAKIREVAKTTATDVYNHLKAYGWNIRDENGENDTSADYVDGLLRAGLLASLVHMGDASLQADYDKEVDKFIDLSNITRVSDRFNNYQQYFAYNLRASRAFAIWILEGPESDKGKQMANYVEENLWVFTKGHKNGWFALLRAAMTPSDIEARDEGVYSLRSLSLKPVRMWSSPFIGQEQKPTLLDIVLGCHRNFVIDPHLRKPEDYSTWQKEPWDPGKGDDWDKEGRGDASGLDFLLAYWLGRFIGAL